MLVADMEKLVSPRSGGRMFRIHNSYLVLLLIWLLDVINILCNSPYDYILCLCWLAENWLFVDEKEPVAHALVEVVEASDVKPSGLNG